LTILPSSRGGPFEIAGRADLSTRLMNAPIYWRGI
jgi:hypothetical protein